MSGRAPALKPGRFGVCSLRVKWDDEDGADTLPGAPPDKEISPAAESSDVFTATSVGDCLIEDELLAYQAGGCSEVQLSRLDAHLDGCASCRELVHYVLGSKTPADEEAEAAETTVSDGWLTTFNPGNL